MRVFRRDADGSKEYSDVIDDVRGRWLELALGVERADILCPHLDRGN